MAKKKAAEKTSHPSAVRPTGLRDYQPMATAKRKVFSSARILLFTPTGKAVPVSEERLADERLFSANFPVLRHTNEEMAFFVQMLRRFGGRERIPRSDAPDPAA
jgi:hypothetical protein